MTALRPTEEFAQNASVELEALKALVSLLRQENTALAADDTEALLTLAISKSALVETLSACAARRDRLVPAGAATSDMRSMINSTSQMRRLWDLIMDAARQAAQLNIGNSYVVCQRLAKVHRALGVLGAASSPVYHAGGTSIGKLDHSRSFGRA